MATTTTTTTLPATLLSTGTVRFRSAGTVETVTQQEGALSFGTVGPGGTSDTIAVSLTSPLAITIGNIQIALIETGGIDFTNTSFGFATSQELDYNIVPTTYFQGINTDNLSTNRYNISVENRSGVTSNYVYLNIKLPDTFSFTTGIVRYKWFFDYND